MSDSVIRLHLESRDYEAKLSRASKGLTDLQANLRQAGRSFAEADKEQVAFASQMGKMPTVAQSVTGKLSELKRAYQELSVQYQQLTDKERNSPLGQAMKGSMTDLQSRIGTLNSQMQTASREIGGGLGQAFEQLAGKIGLPMQALSPLGAGVAAAAGAFKVASDAIKSNETVMDSWRATCEAGKSVYSSFLYSLNNGNFGGFLSNIGDAIDRAKEFYGALDELGTFRAFNQANVLRAQAAFNNAYADYRTGDATIEEVQAASDAYLKNLQKEQSLAEQVYTSALQKFAAEHHGLDIDLVRKAFTGEYGTYQALKEVPLAYDEITQYSSVGTYTTKTRALKQTPQALIGEALRAFSDEELATLQGYAAEAARLELAISQHNRSLARLTAGAKNTPAPEPAAPAEPAIIPLDPQWGKAAPVQEGTQADWQQRMQTVRNSMQGNVFPEEYRQMAEYLRQLEQEYSNLFLTQQTGHTAEAGSLDDLNSQLREALNTLQQLSPESENWATALQTVADKQAAVNALQEQINGTLKPAAEATEEQAKTADLTKQQWSLAAGAVQSVGSALQSIENPAAKVSGIIAQAVATTALAFAQAVAADSRLGALPMIAAAATGLATMTSMIASIRSATQGFAEGGIIGGNNPSGDNIIARVNSGEGILTAQGVSNLDRMFNQQGRPHVRLTATIQGEDIILTSGYAQRRRGDRGATLRTR